MSEWLFQPGILGQNGYQCEKEQRVEPHGQEPVAPMVRRNLPKLQASFAKASEDTAFLTV